MYLGLIMGLRAVVSEAGIEERVGAVETVESTGSRRLELYFCEVIRRFGSPTRDAPVKLLCPVRPEAAAKIGLSEPVTLFGLKFVVYSSQKK